ncbi:ribonuclease H-like domain-containing protein, partial [Tanacetum coccineum]
RVVSLDSDEEEHDDEEELQGEGFGGLWDEVVNITTFGIKIKGLWKSSSCCGRNKASKMSRRRNGVLDFGLCGIATKDSFDGVTKDQAEPFSYCFDTIAHGIRAIDDINSNDNSNPKNVVGSSSDLNLSFGNPLYLHPNDTSGTLLVTIKLTGTKNYKMWSISMTFALRNHNKLGFIDGSCKKDSSNHGLANQWDMCNSVVVTWILNSLSPELFASAIYAKTASEIWNDLKETYDNVDGSAVFNLHKNINSLNQNGSPLADYHNKLNSLWKQFDAMVSLPACTCAAAKHFDQHNQLIKLMQFLMGLDESYLAIRRPLNLQQLPLGPNPNLKYTNCNKTSHTMDRCFELIGYPTGYVKRNFNSNSRPVTSNNASADVHSNGLTVGHPNGTQALITKIGDLKINNEVTLYDVLDLKANKNVGIGKQYNSLYLFDADNAYKHVSNNCIASCSASKTLWHQRLGHPADQVLDVLKTTLNLDIHSKSNHLCDTCNKAKQARESFPLSNHKTTKIGELVHLDVWVPYKITSRDGFRYFSTIVDDFSRAVWVYMLKGKDDVYDSLISFVQMFLNQFEININVFRSDNGTEFTNNRLPTFFNDKGILHQTTCIYTPQQNGIAERKHRHLLNVARSFMIPSSVLSGKSPYSYVYGHEPSLSHFRVFGYLCYATILNNQDKFSRKVSSNDDGPELSPDLNQGNDDSSATSMDETNNTHLEGTISKETDFLNDFYVNSEFNSETKDLPVHNLRRSSRQTKLPSSLNDFIVEGKVKYGVDRVVNYVNLNHDNYCFASALNKSVEPTCYEEFILDSNWIDAMNAEIEALNENHTWEITDLPPNRKAIRNKWIYKIKYKSSGDIDRYKVRLVVKGFSQKENIDFDVTFSPVVKMSTVRCVIALSVTNNWPLFQLDVNNAFLYLKGSPVKGIRYTYSKYKNTLSGYSDADWAKCLKTRKSVTGYCVFFNNCLISWKSKKQNTISKSSIEAMYRSLSSAAYEII